MPNTRPRPGPARAGPAFDKGRARVLEKNRRWRLVGDSDLIALAVLGVGRPLVE